MSGTLSRSVADYHTLQLPDRGLNPTTYLTLFAYTPRRSLETAKFLVAWAVNGDVDTAIVSSADYGAYWLDTVQAGPARRRGIFRPCWRRIAQRVRSIFQRYAEFWYNTHVETKGDIQCQLE